MKTLQDRVEKIQREIATWDTPFVEPDCFGTDSAQQIAQLIDEFCRSHLGSKIRGYLFFASSVGYTHLLEPATTEWDEDSWPYLLRSEGEALLREAVE